MPFLTLGPVLPILPLRAILPLRPVFRPVDPLGPVGALMAITETGMLVVLPLRPGVVVGGSHVGRTRLLSHGIAHDHRLLMLAAVVVATDVVALIVDVGPEAVGLRPAAIAALERGLSLLLAVDENDAIVVLGMLQIVLGEHMIAGGIGVAGELQVFLGNVGGSAADFHVGAIRFIAPSKRVLPLAVALAALIALAAVTAMATVAAVAAIAVVVAATSTAMLLSLPHGLPISQLLMVQTCVMSKVAHVPSDQLSDLDHPILDRASDFDGPTASYGSLLSVGLLSDASCPHPIGIANRYP